MNKARILYFSIFWTFLLFGVHSKAMAQEEEPVQTEEEDTTYRIPPVLDEDKIDDPPIEVVDTVSGLNPTTSAFYSAVLPGLGQAYNGSHWKIPLIYIGGAFVVYSVNFNNRQYSTAFRNLKLVTLDPNAATELGRDQGYYNRAAQFYRRNRDYSIIMGTLLYGLNILDAYVDAHLQDFEINDDLAVRVKPALIPTPGGPTGTGIALTLQFK